MATIQLRDLCGVRCGDKGDISDLTLFADDQAAYEALRSVLTADVVKAHLGSIVQGEVVRYEAENVWALKFVCQDALGGGAPRSRPAKLARLGLLAEKALCSGIFRYLPSYWG